MKQYHRSTNFKNRLVLVAFLVAAVLLMSVYYRNSDTTIIQGIKKGAVNSLAYVQIGAKKVFSPIYNGWVFLVELKDANYDNVTLRKENSDLKQRIYQLRIIEEENKRLRKLVQAPLERKYKTVMAIPVGSSSNNWEASIIIDKGENHGVKKHMPVVSKDGLVGQVVNSAPFASQVQLITDTKSGAAATIVGRNINGLVKGTYDNELEMTLVNKISKVKVGDLVITSGLGGVYPRGLFIGRIKSVKSPPAALYKDIKIESEVNFVNIKETLVIKSPLPPSLDELK